jgi:hypothetical protein
MPNKAANTALAVWFLLLGCAMDWVRFAMTQHGMFEKLRGLVEIDETWVDQRSVAELNNCIVDYVDTLEGASFKFENPNVKSTCGCVSSFSV